MADEVLRQGGTRYISTSMRGTGDASGYRGEPEIRRWAHPIEPSQQRRPAQNNCEPMQSILCALAGQNQVLCTIKTELDEIYAMLRDGADDPQ